jgi:hypothetical protein
MLSLFRGLGACAGAAGTCHVWEPMRRGNPPLPRRRALFVRASRKLCDVPLLQKFIVRVERPKFSRLLAERFVAAMQISAVSWPSGLVHIFCMSQGFQ